MATEVLLSVNPRRAVAAKLRRMASVQARLERVQAELERHLDAVRRRYDDRTAALQQHLRDLALDLEGLCRSEREAVFVEGRKSYWTPYGEVAFRKAEPTVQLCDGLTEAEACRLLRRARLARLVRVKETPDRAAIRKALSEARLKGDRLRRCGLELVEQPEHFRCRIGRGGSQVRPGVGGNPQ